MDKQTAVDWMVKAASGTTVHIDRELASRLLNEVEVLLDHWHPDPNGPDYRCEFCGHTPKSVWDFVKGRYTPVPTIHKHDCTGWCVREALIAALGA